MEYRSQTHVSERVSGRKYKNNVDFIKNNNSNSGLVD